MERYCLLRTVSLILALSFLTRVMTLVAGFHDNHLIQKNVRRMVDLTSPILREYISIDVSEYQINKETNLFDYYIAIPEHLEDKLSYVFVSEKFSQDVDKRNWVNAIKTGKKHDNFSLYVVHIPILGRPNAKELSLEIRIAYVHVLRPLPLAISLDEPQSVSCEFNYYFASPYKTESYKLIVDLPKISRVLSYTKWNTSPKKTLNTLDYLSDSRIQPFSDEKNINLHFIFNIPLLDIEKLTRTVDISHWRTSVKIQEEYSMRSIGAKLKDGFSRVDFQKTLYSHQMQQPNAAPILNRLMIAFPKEINDIQYRDEVGNVSTSEIIHYSQSTILDLRPRYPLMGGWINSFSIKYRLPLSNYLKQVLNEFYERKNTLELPLFYPPTSNVSFSEVILKIILPEGSHSIQLRTNGIMEDYYFETAYTYFDSVKRPVVVLTRRNEVLELSRPITVRLRF
jgi:oligosaccharyltransferase complex subunit alpha (ribophorin I)